MSFLPDSLCLIVFLAVSIPISIIDVYTRRIPDSIVFPGILLLLSVILFYKDAVLIDSIVASLSAFLLLLGIRHLTKGLGLGDVKFAAFMGLYCGMNTIFLAFIISAALGLLVASILYFAGKISRKTPIPFGPFLALGAIISRNILPLFLNKL